MQDGSPNDRKIAKLCEYAAKNPCRIPKVIGSLIKIMVLTKYIIFSRILCSYYILNADCKVFRRDFSQGLETGAF